MRQKRKVYSLLLVFAVCGLLITGCGSNSGKSIWNLLAGFLYGGSIQGQTLSLGGVVTTLAGTAGVDGSDDGTGAAASFLRPYGITTDGTNLYVADRDNHLIRKIVIATAVVTTIAGSGGSGQADGTGTAATFDEPAGITTDGTNLYICDKSNHTIRKMVIATGVVTTLAGTADALGTTNGTGAAARFERPYGITTDGTNLYVADRKNHAIRKIVIATGVVTTLAGGTEGDADGTGAAAEFDNPRGLTVVGGNLYVTDWDNCNIRKIVIATGVVTTFAGDNTTVCNETTDLVDGIGTAAHFLKPRGITSDGTNLFVTDYWNSAIRKIVIATAAVTTIAGGTEGDADGTGAAAEFDRPSGITTDGRSLFVTDGEYPTDGNQTIRKID